jgi:hypothetical protein
MPRPKYAPPLLVDATDRSAIRVFHGDANKPLTNYSDMTKLCSHFKPWYLDTTKYVQCNRPMESKTKGTCVYHTILPGLTAEDMVQRRDAFLPYVVESIVSNSTFDLSMIVAEQRLTQREAIELHPHLLDVIHYALEAYIPSRLPYQTIASAPRLLSVWYRRFQTCGWLDVRTCRQLSRILRFIYAHAKDQSKRTLRLVWQDIVQTCTLPTWDLCRTCIRCGWTVIDMCWYQPPSPDSTTLHMSEDVPCTDGFYLHDVRTHARLRLDAQHMYSETSQIPHPEFEPMGCIIPPVNGKQVNWKYEPETHHPDAMLFLWRRRSRQRGKGTTSKDTS